MICLLHVNTVHSNSFRRVVVDRGMVYRDKFEQDASQTIRHKTAHHYIPVSGIFVLFFLVISPNFNIPN